MRFILRSDNKFFKFAWISLFCTGWLQTSFFPPWVAFHGEVFGFLAVCVLFMVVFRDFGKNDHVMISAPEVLLFLVFIVVVIQKISGKSLFIGDAIIYSMYVAGMIFTIGAVRNCAEPNELLVGLAWGILLVGVCSVFIAVMQCTRVGEAYEYIVPMATWRRPGANLAQPNNLGTLLNWALISAIYLFFRKKLQKTVTFLFVGLLLVGLSITESRSALVSVLAISCWLHSAQLIERKRDRWLLSILLSSTALVLFFFWPKFITAIQEGGWSSEIASAGQLNMKAGARLTVWPQLVKAVMMHPITGWGVAGVSAALNSVLGASDLSLPFSYSHNVILDLAIWFGVPVALWIVTIFGLWFFKRIKQINSKKSWYAIALFIPFLFHSLFEFPFAYSYFLFPACIALAILDIDQPSLLQLHLPRWLMNVAFIGWMVLGVMVIHDYLGAEEDFRVARMEALRIGHTPTSYVRPELLVLDQLEVMNTATRSVPFPGMEKNEIELLRIATLRFPWTAIQNRYALALALNGNVPEARRQLGILKAMQGPLAYDAVRVIWNVWAKEKYSQLEGVVPVNN